MLGGNLGADIGNWEGVAGAEIAAAENWAEIAVDIPVAWEWKEGVDVWPAMPENAAAAAMNLVARFFFQDLTLPTAKCASACATIKAPSWLYL